MNMLQISKKQFDFLQSTSEIFFKLNELCQKSRNTSKLECIRNTKTTKSKETHETSTQFN